MHIYVASRLFESKPTAWKKLIADLKKEREFMLQTYAPLRHAVVAEIEEPKSGRRELDKRLASITKLSGYGTIAQASRTALKLFAKDFASNFNSIEENFLTRSYQPSPANFAGNPLEGRFHFHAETEDGEDAYVYVHASSNWKPIHTQAFVELLTIMGESYFDADREQIWFLDLTTGKRVMPAKRYKKLRNELEAVSTLYHDIAELLRSKAEFKNI